MTSTSLSERGVARREPETPYPRRIRLRTKIVWKESLTFLAETSFERSAGGGDGSYPFLTRIGKKPKK
jgi:hypothetical protein